MSSSTTGRQAVASAISYEESKRLAQDDDPGVRAKLAGREDIRPEVLYYLAADSAPEVRCVIAANRNTPAQANLLLARDCEESVRGGVASKVARLTQGLSPEDRAKAQKFVNETLEILARDQAKRVRCIVADALKEVADVPASVIRRLARDDEEEVACPILELSPLLSDLDLLEIMADGCKTGRLRAMSRRRGLGEQVTDAIVATEDRAAIASLLENDSAQIREETIDQLVDRAEGVPEWHQPLVERPHLSGRAAQKLATFIADSLLKRLQARGDLDAETARRVGQEVHRRLTEDEGAKKGDAAGGADGPAAEPSAMQDHVLLRAVATGDRALVRSGLALRTGLGEDVVEKILRSTSPKAVTALAWKADLSMRFATQLQLRMGGIAPQQAIIPRNGSDYPLSPKEMNWQLEFFSTMTG